MKLSIALKILTTPLCWFRNYPYSKEWDKRLNELLDKNSFTEIGEHTAMLGSVPIWTSNYPYAFAHPYTKAKPMLPSRATVFRAYEQLLMDSLEGKYK